MNQGIKNKRKSRSVSTGRRQGMDMSEEMEQTLSGEESSYQKSFSSTSSRSSRSSNVDTEAMGFQQEWDYQKVKEVVSAVYTLVSLFLTYEQKRQVDKVKKDVSGILGVRSLEDWVPPQPLLDVIGLKAGEDMRHHRRAA